MMELMVELIQDLHECYEYIIAKKILFRPIYESKKSLVIYSKIFSDGEILHINFPDLYVSCSM
jgi:hypothetical protein